MPKAIEGSSHKKKREIISVSHCSSGNDEDVLYKKIRTKNAMANKTASIAQRHTPKSSDVPKAQFKPSFQNKTPRLSQINNHTPRHAQAVHTHAPSHSQPQNGMLLEHHSRIIEEYQP